MKNSINRSTVFDEMEQRTLGKAGIICTVITILYLIIESTYKYMSL